MLKKIVLISLLTLQCTYATESVGDLYCNYRLLDKRKESYVGRIIELIPIRSEKIVEDLDFLFSDQEKNFNLRNFTQEDFSKLCEDEKKHEKAIMELESQLSDAPHFFSEDCLKIFFKFQGDPIRQQALYVLLEEVNDELAKYLDEELKAKSFSEPLPLPEVYINQPDPIIVAMEGRNTPEKRKRNLSQGSMLPKKKTLIT